MAILRDFEKRLEGAVEGFFARVFRSGLQPVELAKALQRYAQSFQQVGLDGVFVPNVYRFELSPDDYARFEGFAASLKTELAAVVKQTAASRSWRLHGPVRVELRPVETVTVGTYELRGKIEAPTDRAAAPAPAANRAAPALNRRAAAGPAAAAPRPAPRADDGGHTSVLRRPDSDGAALVAVDGGRRYPVGATATLGRLPECDVTLNDPSVSRRHARISREGDRWSVEDLGSTNGVRVNGAPVTTAELADGDRLELGGVALSFAVDG